MRQPIHSMAEVKGAVKRKLILGKRWLTAWWAIMGLAVVMLGLWAWLLFGVWKGG